MKKYLLLFLGVSLGFVSCNKNDDDPVIEEEIVSVELENEINDFVWTAMNSWYFWQNEVLELGDDRFADTDAYHTFLNGFSEPEDLFLAINSPKDRFSDIFNDYDFLFNSLSGVFKTNGIEFSLVRPPEGGNALVGVVRYIENGSDASTKNIKRGDIFYAVNGTELFAETNSDGRPTSSNIDLLDAETYTLNFATLDETGLVPNGINIEFVKQELTENPIHITKTLEVSGTRIGYLMYNSFTSNFDDELNDAFAQLQADNITELVLDLRYNLGGSVQSATRLASMITGQFTGDIFYTAQWNSNWQAIFGNENTFVDNLEGTPLNSLNLSSLYVITSDDSASSSELLINSLEPYIDVIQIGDITRGKIEFSVTLVDNPDQVFSQTGRPDLSLPFIVLNSDFNTLEGANPNHKYAVQPLVGTNANAEGFGEFTNGLQPDFLLRESFGNLGELGEPGEPLLDLAIQQITGLSGKSAGISVPESMKMKTISSSNQRKPSREIMLYDIAQ